jgi:hypothetical protein
MTMTHGPADPAAPPDTLKSVLTPEQAVKELSYLQSMLQWYWMETDKWERWAWRLQLGTMFTAFLVTVVAALPTPDNPVLQQWMKWAIVGISALASLLAGLLSKSGIERTAQLRELGRIQLVTLEQKAILRLTKELMTPADRRLYLDNILDETREVEQRFGVHPLVAGARSRKSGPGI